MKKTVVFYASDLKGKNVLVNTFKAFKDFANENPDALSVYFIYTEANDVTTDRSKYLWDADTETEKSMEKITSSGVRSSTLEFTFATKPDWLIVNRERWMPEQAIMDEFIRAFGAEIGVIEVNSHVLNNIETWMEMLSRGKYPQVKCRYFFEHSDFTISRRKEVVPNNIEGEFINVGNPRFERRDLICSDSDTNATKEKYDDGRSIVYWCSVINTGRKEALMALKNTIEKIDKSRYRVVYSPYPGERANRLFSSQFVKPNNITFEYKGEVHSIDVDIIKDESESVPLLSVSKIMVSQINSMFMYGFMFNINIVCLNSVIPSLEAMNDVETYMKELKNGVEDSAKFWTGVHGFNNVDEWKQFVVGANVIETFKSGNKYVYEEIKKLTYMYDYNLEFLDNIENLSNVDHKYRQHELRKMFERDNTDGKTPSVRILNKIMEYK